MEVAYSRLGAAEVLRCCVSRSCAGPSRLVGVDIATESIDLARSRIAAKRSGAEVLVADVRQLPFDSGSFDVVVDFGTCYHIEEPEIALLEMSRVLTVGGSVIVESPLINNNALSVHNRRAISEVSLYR